MCFSTSVPKPPPPPPIPNRADQANQAAVQGALQRVRKQNATAQTTLTGGLGDPNFGKDITRVTLLGQSGQ